MTELYKILFQLSNGFLHVNVNKLKLSLIVPFLVQNQYLKPILVQYPLPDILHLDEKFYDLHILRYEPDHHCVIQYLQIRQNLQHFVRFLLTIDQYLNLPDEVYHFLKQVLQIYHGNLWLVLLTYQQYL